MFIKQKKLFWNLTILKLLFFSPFFISLPLLNQQEVQAGLEFQWDQGSGFRRLKWYQKDERKRARNKIFFFLRPSDRRSDLLKINLTIPKKFSSTLKEEKISLCKVKIGGFEGRTKCINDIPADIEINEENSTVNIFPYNPIPANKDSYAVVFKVFNPKRQGLFQFHSYGQPKGTISQSYLGSWTIVID